jgi:hypothetical protein
MTRDLIVCLPLGAMNWIGAMSSYRPTARGSRIAPSGTAFAVSKPEGMIIQVCGGRAAMPLKILVYSDYV